MAVAIPLVGLGSGAAIERVVDVVVEPVYSIACASMAPVIRIKVRVPECRGRQHGSRIWSHRKRTRRNQARRSSFPGRAAEMKAPLIFITHRNFRFDCGANVVGNGRDDQGCNRKERYRGYINVIIHDNLPGVDQKGIRSCPFLPISN